MCHIGLTLNHHAFSLDWSQYVFYAFPPFSVILMMLQKIEMDGATGACVVPNWPTQPWYPKLVRMVVKPPVMARHSRTLLHKSSSQKVGPYDLYCIRENLTKKSLFTDSQDIILASWKKGTSKQYHTYIKKWTEFC